MSKQPTVLLPSGQTCRPVRLRSIYKSLGNLRGYDESFGIVQRITQDQSEDAAALWARNPYVVSSVNPSDLAEYNEERHPTVTRKSGQTWREAREDAEHLAALLAEQGAPEVE